MRGTQRCWPGHFELCIRFWVYQMARKPPLHPPLSEVGNPKLVGFPTGVFDVRRPTCGGGLMYHHTFRHPKGTV